MQFELINKAIKFAADAHTGQYRKGTETPYIVHPLEAGVIASSMTDDENIIAAAFLHDTIEDTATSAEDLRREFGDEVARLVLAESENKRKDIPEVQSWKTRKQETIDHLKECNDEGIKIIALADKLANIRNIRRDYCEIEGKIWSRFNQSDPKEIGWYYRSFTETCRCLKDKDAYKEYCNIVSELFGNC